jgi:hypothetical protein
LFSGGHATYGGLRTYEPYDGKQQGVQGYYDAVAAGTLQGGAHDFCHIHRFFVDSGLALVGMTPDDALVGSEPRRWKCIRDRHSCLVYLANPTGDDPGTDDAAASAPSVSVPLPEGACAARWFGPSTGRWYEAEALVGGMQTLTAPGAGDWVLWLQP